jgi:hypothetical protein
MVDTPGQTCNLGYIIWFMVRIIFIGLLTLFAVPAAMAQGTNGTPDKSIYNLFNPTPDNLMRELAPDRPDKTDGPFTVDAGHFQWEMDFANYTEDKTDGLKTEAWNVAPFNLRIGLLDKVEFQVAYDDYLNVRTHDDVAGVSTRQSGFGDLNTRLKINLWGNESGTTAFGLFPFLKFPVNTDHLGNNAVEGGIGFPLAIKLPHDFDLGLETAFNIFRNDSDSNYHADFVNSITLDHTLIGKLSGYVEFFSDISAERHSGWIGTVDTGLEYQLSESVQLDCGCNFGVTRAADDFNPFAGITVRF